jgi:hypothetical protein
LLVSAAAGVTLFPVWPGPDSRELDQPGSPGVKRNGQRLEFTGTLPWVGRHKQGERAGRRVSFGDAPPDEDPPPRAWEHYAPDAVIVHGPQRGTQTFTPTEFERTVRFNYFNLVLLQNFLITAVFYFVISLLLRFKRVDLPPFGSLGVLGRCLIPACAYSAVFAIFSTKLAATLAVCAFLLVLAMNALLFILGATPRPTQAGPSFDV